MKQTHGNHTTFIDDPHQTPAVDALITTQKHLALCVRTADCLPILLADKKNGVIGAIHAGWKGIYHEIIHNALNLMYEYGAEVQHIRAHIQPCVRACCYEIYGERKELFARRFPAHVSEIFRDEDPDTYLDLVACARIQLTTLGVPAPQIEVAPECTSCHPHQYPSYHRDPHTKTHMISSIWMT